MSKILFLTTSHHYNDDRIFYHQAKTLLEYGHQIKICSLSSDFKGVLNEIQIEACDILSASRKKKLHFFSEVCKAFEPHCIICSEPLAVFAARAYRKTAKTSVVYDITEWYPSNRMVQQYPCFVRWLHWFKFFLIQGVAGFFSTHFIFGEASKKFPLANLFPFKPKIQLPYYPDDSYIVKAVKQLTPGRISLSYAGAFTKEKGIGNLLKAMKLLQTRNPEVDINILLMGAPPTGKEQIYFESLLQQYSFKNLEIVPQVRFEDFSAAGAETDVFFDLREQSRENHQCLPIKIFYYAAAGKPVIYSDLKAIRQHLEIQKFGYLVDPEDAKQICSRIESYIHHPELYAAHAQNARELYMKKYSWDLIKNRFVTFIHKAIKT